MKGNAVPLTFILFNALDLDLFPHSPAFYFRPGKGSIRNLSLALLRSFSALRSRSSVMFADVAFQVVPTSKDSIVQSR